VASAGPVPASADGATGSEITAHLGLSPRTVVALGRVWPAGGFLVLHDPSRKNRSYRLTPEYKSVYKKHHGSSLLSMRTIMAICMKASVERGDCS